MLCSGWAAKAPSKAFQHQGKNSYPDGRLQCKTAGGQMWLLRDTASCRGSEKYEGVSSTWRSKHQCKPVCWHSEQGRCKTLTACLMQIPQARGCWKHLCSAVATSPKWFPSATWHVPPSRPAQHASLHSNHPDPQSSQALAAPCEDQWVPENWWRLHRGWCHPGLLSSAPSCGSALQEEWRHLGLTPRSTPHHPCRCGHNVVGGNWCEFGSCGPDLLPSRPRWSLQMPRGLLCDIHCRGERLCTPSLHSPTESPSPTSSGWFWRDLQIAHLDFPHPLRSCSGPLSQLSGWRLWSCAKPAPAPSCRKHLHSWLGRSGRRSTLHNSLDTLPSSPSHCIESVDSLGLWLGIGCSSCAHRHHARSTCRVGIWQPRSPHGSHASSKPPAVSLNRWCLADDGTALSFQRHQIERMSFQAALGLENLRNLWPCPGRLRLCEFPVHPQRACISKLRRKGWQLRALDASWCIAPWHGQKSGSANDSPALRLKMHSLSIHSATKTLSHVVSGFCQRTPQWLRSTHSPSFFCMMFHASPSYTSIM